MSEGADPLDVAVGQVVRGLRKQRGLSQSELGDRLGVSFHQIRGYECGARQLNLPTLVRIARALDCRSSDLLARIDGPSGGRVAALVAGDAEAAELLRLYSSIRSQDMRRALLHVARAAAGAKRLSNGRDEDSVTDSP